MNYFYPNIQFLRAISVLFVFFYHLKLDIFKFGYIGVDIFFVISGFVITSRIYEELIKKKSINLLSFYKKRFKRIFPVLIFIISIVLLFSIIFQPLDQLVKNIYVFFFTIFGSANLYYLFSNKDYFDNIFEDVFGHTWSLGVEEQFYLIFPFLLLFIFKFYKKRTVHLLILSILIIIGIFATIFFSDDNKLIFYSPLFRFWQLLLGSFSYILSKNFKKKDFRVSLVAFILLLALSLNTPFINNLSAVILSTIAASFFLLFYETNKKLNFIFENNRMVFLGNISYSFYLWHLPVIYFFDLYFIENIFRIPLLFSLIFLLSTLTYFYIESNFRYKNFGYIFLKKTIIFFGASFGIIFIFFYYLTLNNENKNFKISLKDFIYSKNFLENSFDYTNRTNFYRISLNEKKVYTHCIQSEENNKSDLNNLKSDCLKKGLFDDRIFFIMGNSHTVNYIPIFDSIDMVNGDSIYFEHRAWRFDLYDGLSKNILNIDLIKKINGLKEHYKEVFFVTNIEPYNIDFLNDINMTLDKDIKVLVLSTIPNTNENLNTLECYIKRINCQYLRSKDFKKRNLNSYYKKIQKIINSSSREKFLFFDSYDSICPQEICFSYNYKEDFLTHVNSSHLSIEGSLSIKKNFLKFYNEELTFQTGK